MKKRIAYIGLSYPLLYDYKHNASRAENDLSDSPNPIIESPLGLMILYDELWFLCESICPNNMRNLPYIKFVGKMFPDLYYIDPHSFIQDDSLSIYLRQGLSYHDILDRMSIAEWSGLDTHTHGFKLGSITLAASAGIRTFLFDIYVFSALQERISYPIELLSNSLFAFPESQENSHSNKGAEIAERLIISNIPNYLSTDGPYHPCMEEMRENKFLKDFRVWIAQNHSSIQSSEISEICDMVNKNIQETKNSIFTKYLENNTNFKY